MYCDQCGANLQPNQPFCAQCGKAVTGVPLMPHPPRMAGHVRLLGILWLAISAFRLLPGIWMVAFGGWGMPFMPHVPFFVGPFLATLGIFILAGAVAGFIAGWGLLDYQPWARVLAIVLGILSLPEVPFGTALGIYTLWVLLPAHSQEEYRRMARVA
ncbi:MAG: zinc ribbon domain-containing protein [Terriglobales bacterium]